MTKTQAVLAVVIAVLVLSVSYVQTYKAGQRQGYNAGWSDANCGPGRDCEAGQF